MDPRRLRINLTFLLLLTACSPGGPPEPAANPDEAHDRLMQGLAERRPEVLWDALPASYQRDIEGLIHDSVGSVDEELWNKSAAVLQKATRVLGEKKAFILENRLVAMNLGDDPDLDKHWDAVVRALDDLVHSEIADLSRVRTLDVREFLAGTGGRLLTGMAEAESLMPEGLVDVGLEDIGRTRATIASVEGDRATLSIDSPVEGTSEEVWVRLEGKWIPEEWTEDWGEDLADARRGLEEMSSGMTAADRQQALMRLTMVEGVLDQLLAAESAEDFNATLGSALGMVVGSLG